MKKQIIRKAKLNDCEVMQKIINSHARSGAMLRKNIAYIKTRLSDFFVVEIDGMVRGVCGIKIWPSGLVEVISSAVHSDFHNRGIGEMLNRSCIAYAHELGFKNLFVLTKRVTFYARLGFVKIPKSKLSAKILTDCLPCKFNKSGVKGKVFCDDIAMRLTIK